MLNAVANTCSKVERTNHFVPSCDNQSPVLNSFMESCIAREKTLEAMRQNEEEEVDVLNDSEMVELWEATNLDKPSEVQRLFAAQRGYNSGLRGRSFERTERKLEPKLLKRVFYRKRKIIQPNIAKMKKLVPSLSKFDLAVFEQQIIEREDEQMCAVKGVFCQLDLLTKKRAPVCKPDCCFRTGPMKYEIYVWHNAHSNST